MLDGKIILVDDNEAVLKTLKMILAREFKTLVGVSVPTLLPALLREGDVDIVLLDMNFVTGRQDGSEGLFWLDRIVGRPDPPQVVLITAFGDIELAVSALKRGAADFVVKPWDNEKLVAILQGAFRRRRKVRTEAASMRRISAEEENGQVVSLLVGSLLKKYAQAYGKQLPVVTSGGLDKLSGLIRQGDLSALQQTIERAVLLTDSSSLGADDFHIEKTASASRPVTLEEFQKVISLLYKGDYYEHYLFISFWLLFMTGMRIGEAAALQWDDIDFETGMLIISKTLYYKTMNDYKFVEPKTQASNRTIYIDADTIKELQEWKAVQAKVLPNYGFVLSYNSTPTSKTTLPRALEKLANLAGVHRIKIHALRHSHASLLISMGENPLLIKERLGHEKIQTTLGTYGHLYPNTNIEIAKKLTGVLSYQSASQSIANYTSNQHTAMYHKEI